MAVGVVADEPARENQQGFEAKGLAKSLDDLAQVLGLVAVTAYEAVERGHAEAVPVDFYGAALENVGDARGELVFKDFGDFEVEDTVEAYTMVEVPRE